MNKLQWNLNQNTKLFVRKNTFENVVCEIVVILSRERWVKKSNTIGNTAAYYGQALDQRVAYMCITKHRLFNSLRSNDMRQ